MNKKFLSVILFSALMVGTARSRLVRTMMTTSRTCKDNWTKKLHLMT